MPRPVCFVFWLFCLIALSRCGVTQYPGQPGVVTDGYSKIDVEFLMEDGLWVYEVSYDNRPLGSGVGAIVTKLYPGVHTYTSNVRTNADGTVYRAKGQYNGASVQMISTPRLNQVMLPPDSLIGVMVSYDVSLDEVDTRNLAEENLFTGPTITPLSRGWSHIKKRWEILKIGRFTRTASLAYDIQSLNIGGEVFKPSQPIVVETNLLQNGVRVNNANLAKQELKQFIEAKFPKGFSGNIQVSLNGVSEPITLPLSIHTLKTAESSGIKVLRNVSPETLGKTIVQLGVRK